MSFGCGLVNRNRRMPGTAPTARNSSANCGLTRTVFVASRWRSASGQVTAVAVHVLTEQGDLGDAVFGAVVAPRSTMSSNGRLISAAANSRHDAERARVVASDLDCDPRVVTGLAANGKCAREHRLIVDDSLVEDLGDRPSAARAASISSLARCTLCVPSTTSTHGARCRTPSRSFWAMHPATTSWRPGTLSFQLLRWPRLP